MKKLIIWVKRIWWKYRLLYLSRRYCDKIELWDNAYSS
jgi:hypothetical protein